jgi:hypothetical protein
MTEEEFIKKYFEDKKSINENEVLKQVAGNVIDFVTDSNPIAKLAKSAIQYGLSRGVSDLGDYISGKTKSFFSSDSKSSSSSDSKNKKIDPNTKDVYVKNLIPSIQTSPELYLKFFLIYYAIYFFSKKGTLTLAGIDDIYKDLKNEKFKSLFDNNTTLINTDNITNAIIYYDEKKISNENGFKEIMKSLFVDKTNHLGNKFYAKINQAIGSSKTLNITSIKSVFINFFKSNGSKYSLDEE